MNTIKAITLAMITGAATAAWDKWDNEEVGPVFVVNGYKYHAFGGIESNQQDSFADLKKMCTDRGMDVA